MFNHIVLSSCTFCRNEQAQIEGGDADDGEEAAEGEDAEMEEDDDEEEVDDSDLPPELRMNEYDEDEDNEMNGFEDNIDGVDDIAVSFSPFCIPAMPKRCLIFATTFYCR